MDIFFDDGLIQCKTNRHYGRFPVLNFCPMFLAGLLVLMPHYVHNSLMVDMIVKDSFVANMIDMALKEQDEQPLS